MQQCVYIRLTGMTPYFATVFVYDERRYGINLLLTCERFVFVDVKLMYLRFTVKLLFYLLDHGHHAAAVGAPRCVKLDEYHVVSVDNFVVVHNIYINLVIVK